MGLKGKALTETQLPSTCILLLFVVSQRSTLRIFLMDFLGKKSAPQKSTADQSKYSLPFYRTEDLGLLPGEISIDDFESYASKRIESMN